MRKSTVACRVGLLALALPSFHGRARSQDPPAATIAWETLRPTKLTSSGNSTLTLDPDGTIVVANAPDKDVITLECAIDRRGVNGIRLEALADPKLPAGGPGLADNGNFALTELKVAQAPKNSDAFKPVVLEHASADFEQTGFPAVGAVDGSPGTGWAIFPSVGVSHEAIFETIGLGFEAGAKLIVTLEFQLGARHECGRIRLSTTTAPKPLRAGRDLSGVAEAQGRIPGAIERGVNWLLDQQELDGSWAYVQPQYHHGMTALACYTLIKCGVKKSHPAVLRALDFMATQPPEHTYEAGLELMARAAMEDDADVPRMQSIVDRLLQWQAGGWSYPSTKPDLSNTQYAAMGLRAAALRGAKVPNDAWIKLGEETLLHQEKASGAYEPAGFGYYAGSPAYGSITAGGTCVLQICQEQLEKAGQPRAAFSAAARRGVTWLDRNFAPTVNPKGDGAWIWYWLYGVERVGGLCKVEELGGRSWYREGASHIVASQKPEGSWDGGGGPQPSTCFALLFLARATSSVSGVPHRAENLYGGDDPAFDVSLRASGDTPLAVWISSFGEKPSAELAWPEDGPNGLRVARVDYVLPVRALLPDAPSDASPWHFTTDAPTGGWELPAFDDRKWKSGAGDFGRGSELWLRREFTLPALGESPLVAPALRVRLASRAPASDPSSSSLVCLFDEEPAFADLVNEGDAAATIRAVDQDAYQGKWALAVTPPQRFRAAMPGWGLSIAEKPRPGEYRYLRFAWKKEGGGGIMLQLAQDGNWGAKTRRVVAGPNDAKWAATEVAKEPPRRWTVVTIDLWKEFGANGILTGIAFTPMTPSTGFFDAIYLARSLDDFKTPPKTGTAAPQSAPVAAAGGAVVPAPTTGAAAPAAGATPPSPLSVATGEGPALDVFLNGTRVFAASEELAEKRDVTTLVPLETLLASGRNVLAVQARRPAGDPWLELEIVDQRVVASVAGDGNAPCGANRFPAQISFEKNGLYPVHARVHVVPPAGGERLIESPPLTIPIREALDAELLSYAKDPARNLIALAGATATASSAFDANWLPQRAIDRFAASGWLSSDTDRQPELTIELTKPVRADTVLVTPIQMRGGDPERAFHVRRVRVLIDQGRSGSFEIAMPDDFRKGVVRLPKPTVIRRLDVKLLDASGVVATKPALGLGEVELQLRK
jgi:hypothetical protein